MQTTTAIKEEKTPAPRAVRTNREMGFCVEGVEFAREGTRTSTWQHQKLASSTTPVGTDRPVNSTTSQGDNACKVETVERTPREEEAQSAAVTSRTAAVETEFASRRVVIQGQPSTPADTVAVRDVSPMAAAARGSLQRESASMKRASGSARVEGELPHREVASTLSSTLESADVATAGRVLTGQEGNIAQQKPMLSGVSVPMESTGTMPQTEANLTWAATEMGPSQAVSCLAVPTGEALLQSEQDQPPAEHGVKLREGVAGSRQQAENVSGSQGELEQSEVTLHLKKSVCFSEKASKKSVKSRWTSQAKSSPEILGESPLEVEQCRRLAMSAAGEQGAAHGTAHTGPTAMARGIEHLQGLPQQNVDSFATMAQEGGFSESVASSSCEGLAADKIALNKTHSGGAHTVHEEISHLSQQQDDAQAIRAKSDRHSDKATAMAHQRGMLEGESPVSCTVQPLDAPTQSYETGTMHKEGNLRQKAAALGTESVQDTDLPRERADPLHSAEEKLDVIRPTAVAADQFGRDVALLKPNEGGVLNVVESAVLTEQSVAAQSAKVERTPLSVVSCRATGPDESLLATSKLPPSERGNRSRHSHDTALQDVVNAPEVMGETGMSDTPQAFGVEGAAAESGCAVQIDRMMDVAVATAQMQGKGADKSETTQRIASSAAGATLTKSCLKTERSGAKELAHVHGQTQGSPGTAAESFSGLQTADAQIDHAISSAEKTKTHLDGS